MCCKFPAIYLPGWTGADAWYDIWAQAKKKIKKFFFMLSWPKCEFCHQSNEQVRILLFWHNSVRCSTILVVCNVKRAPVLTNKWFWGNKLNCRGPFTRTSFIWQIVYGPIVCIDSHLVLLTMSRNTVHIQIDRSSVYKISCWSSISSHFTVYKRSAVNCPGWWHSTSLKWK